MIAVLRWVVRFLLRRFGWVALVAGVRSLARRGGQRKIDEATDDVAANLPDGVVNALSGLPGDPLRMAGSAVAASRSARRAADLSKSVAESTTTPLRAMDRFRRTVTSWGRAVGINVAEERSSVERQLWADYHRSRGDHARADLSLLDARHATDDSDETDVLWDQVPAQSPKGRLRSVDDDDNRPDRVQRRYQRPRPPWSR